MVLWTFLKTWPMIWPIRCVNIGKLLQVMKLWLTYTYTHIAFFKTLRREYVFKVAKLGWRNQNKLQLICCSVRVSGWQMVNGKGCWETLVYHKRCACIQRVTQLWLSVKSSNQNSEDKGSDWNSNSEKPPICKYTSTGDVHFLWHNSPYRENIQGHGWNLIWIMELWVFFLVQASQTIMERQQKY